MIVYFKQAYPRVSIASHPRQSFPPSLAIQCHPVTMAKKGGGSIDCIKDRKNAIDSMFRSLETAKIATMESKQLAVGLKATKDQFPHGQLQLWYTTVVAAVKELMMKSGTSDKLKASLYAAIKLYDDAVKRCSDKDI